MTSALLAHVKILSLWEVAHYWHDCDPRVSQTHHLPLKVRDTLLVFSMEFGSSLSIRVEQDKAYLLEFINTAPRFTARHYRHSFKNAIDRKVFGKRFFSKMFITRSQLARWCMSKNEPLPKFWYPDNDKFPYIAEGDLTDETTSSGRYKVQLLYDDRQKPSNNDAPQEQPIAATVNKNAVKAANAKNAPMNAIKELFINFHQSQGSSAPKMAVSARRFYFNLSAEQNQLFKHKEAAIRTLTSALSNHLKEIKQSQ